MMAIHSFGISCEKIGVHSNISYKITQQLNLITLVHANKSYMYPKANEYYT
jgi:hypothetical protein